MLKLGIAAGLVVGLFAGQAQALPLTCSGTIKDVGLSGSATLTDMSGGNCVSAGDKLFGDASVGGALTGTGSVNFSATSLQGNVTVAFIGTVAPNTSGDINYSVAINPALAGGLLIHDLEKDFTFNSNTEGSTATATLTGTATLPTQTLTFSCVRTIDPNTSTCPVTEIFDLAANMTVNQHIAAGDNAVVTAITDTISQAVPEPGSLLILGSGLLGMAFLRRRRHSSPA